MRGIHLVALAPLAGALAVALVAGGTPIEPAAVSQPGSRGFEEIDEDGVSATLAVLCSPYLEGRDSPSRGLAFACDYVAKRFEEAGLESPEGVDGYLATYTRNLPAPDLEESRLESPLEREVAAGVDFVPLLGCPGSARGPAVFCGYGIGVKEFDELDDLELAGAIAVLVEGEPRHKRVLRGEEVSEAANVFRKLQLLRDAGAVGALVVRRPVDEDESAPRGWPAREELPFRHTWAMWVGANVPVMGPSPIPALQVSWAFAEELLGDDLDARMKSIDRSGKPKPWEGPRPEVSIASVTVQRDVPIANVVGIVRGSDPKLRDEYVVIGAHLDHIGVDPLGRIGRGADDNASGSAAMLEAVEALAAEPPARSVLAISFTSEEDGLLGSKAIARDLPVPRESVVAMVNLDMIGRGERDGCVALGIRENPLMEDIVDEARRRFRTGIKSVETRKGQELFARSDHYSFHEIGIPAVFFFEHVPLSDNPDYHTWRDLEEYVDTRKIANTSRLAYGVTRLLADREERLPRPGR
ncbi:MAG: M20/M25/M40 family metallo-hydrolase [Planctomycetota bacterium]